MSFLTLTLLIKLTVQILKLKGLLLYLVIFFLSFFCILLSKISPFKEWSKSFDVCLLDSVCIQFLLFRSMQLETLYDSRNYADRFCTYIMASSFIACAVAGFLTVSIGSIVHPIQIYLVLCFFWSSFYVRLRWNYLNYDHLKLDKVPLSWDNFIKQICVIEGLSISNKIELKSDIILFSFNKPAFWSILIRDFGFGASKVAAEATAKVAKKVKVSEEVVTKVAKTSCIFSGVAAVGIFLYQTVTVNSG